MPVAFAEILVNVLLAYAGIGALFALAFVSIGIARVDPAARGVSVGLRLLLLPGSAALWPLLLMRWLKGRAAPDERTPHKLRASAQSAEGRSS